MLTQIESEEDVRPRNKEPKCFNLPKRTKWEQEKREKLCGLWG